MAHDIWEYENAGEIFSHLIPDSYVMHATTSDESQFGSISYEHPHNPFAPVSYDYCYFSDHDADSYPHVSPINSRIDQIEQEMKDYRESMEIMKRIHIDQFLELVKGHLESIMPVLHGTWVIFSLLCL